MSYFAPHIDASGLHIPTYPDIRDSLIEDARIIFGQDIYLEIDTQDYQWISAVAVKVYDAFQLLQVEYLNRSPRTAMGSALDTLVAINGIRRKEATKSVCTVRVTGSSGTIITNGIVGDISENLWNLPAAVTILPLGYVDVTATCLVAGPVVANIGDINQITTPTSGWVSVTNLTPAKIGLSVETDAQLRARQAISTAQAALTVLERLMGAVASLAGITRYRLYENDQDSADVNLLPPHSIAVVVEGGDDEEIAYAIFKGKTPGCYLHGDVTVTVKDEFEQPSIIRFFRPNVINVAVTITIKSLPGFTTETTEDIRNRITLYLNSLAIGEPLNISALYGIALMAMTDLRSPIFSILSVTAGPVGNAQGTTDITSAFNAVIGGEIVNVTINVT